MKLIRLSRDDQTYWVTANISFKFLGFTILHTVKEYRKPLNEKKWSNVYGKKVSARKNRILNAWLSDHKKFVEKS